jgi:hypothetical protein
MPRTKQLTIPAQDRPGTLAQIAKILGDSQINIVAMNCAGFGAGVIEIIVDDVNKAKQVLDSRRLPYTEQDVLCVEIDNSPGCLGEFARKLALRGINIPAGYGTAAKDSEKACLVLRVSDIEAASKISGA